MVSSRRPLALRDWLHLASTARFALALAVALLLVWRLRLRRGGSSGAGTVAAQGSGRLPTGPGPATASAEPDVVLVRWTAVVARLVASAAALAVALQHPVATALATPPVMTTAGHTLAVTLKDGWLLSISVPSLALCPGLATPVGLIVSSWLQVAVPVSGMGTARGVSASSLGVD